MDINIGWQQAHYFWAFLPPFLLRLGSLSQKIRDAGWRLLFFGAEPAAGIETSSGLRTPARVSKPGATVRWTVALVRIDSHCILPPRWQQYAVRPRFCLRQNTCNAPLGAASLHSISPDIEPAFAGCEGWFNL